MNPFRYEVSLRIRHPKIGPEEISKALDMTARFKWAAGAARKTQKGKPLKGVYESTYCSFGLDHDKNVGLSDFLAQCNAVLMPHRQFLEHVRSTGGSAEYFIGWYSDSNSGDVFNVDLLKGLAALQIDLSLDVYGASSPKKPSKGSSRTAKKKKAKRKK